MGIRRWVGFALIAAGCRTGRINVDEHVRIESASVICTHKGLGYTTASAYGEFGRADTAGANMRVLNASDCEVITDIMNRARKSRHRQTKMGGGWIFIRASYSRSPYSSGVRLVACRTQQGGWVIDLTRLVNYEISQEADAEWLSKLDSACP